MVIELPGRASGAVGRWLLILGVVLLLAGCATGTAQRTAQVTLRPGPQQPPTHQVVGEAIVASLRGVSVTVRWLPQVAVESYYASRPGLVSPWPRDLWKDAPPTVFLLRVRNLTRDEVQFDPGLAGLATQDGQRERAVPYEELYMRLAETEDPEPRLRSLQATLFSRFIVVQPGGQREGILLFPTLPLEAKHLHLELASFFVGGKNAPGRFEFQVLR